MGAQKQGFSLVELLVVLAVLGLLIHGVSSITSNMMKQVKRVESHQIVNGFLGDLNLMTSKSDTCENMFRQDASHSVLYDPPVNINTAYGVDVPYIYFGSSSVLAGPGLTADQDYSSYMEVEKIRLERIVGSPESSFSYNSTTSSPINVTTHKVNLVVRLKRNNGTTRGTVIEHTKALNLLVNMSNQVVSCEFDPSSKLLRAIGKRRGPTILKHGCIIPAPTEYYLANACTDTDSNGKCDSNGELTVEQATAITSGHKTPSDYEFVTSTTLSTIAEAGRCPFEAQTIPPGYTNDEIFAFLSDATPNGDGFYTDGIGCRNENGWFISGCLRSDLGRGDSDLSFAKVGTVEYCTTNDFSQPHTSEKPWSLGEVVIHIICTKYE